MAIEINKRTKIMAGVAVMVLAGAGAAAWFLFLDEPPPPVTAKQTVKPPAAAPAAQAPKGDAPKADAPKADAPKSEPAKAAEVAQAVPKADAGKAPAAAPAVAAAPAKPGAKPIPADPDKLIGEVIETSGLRAYFQTYGREAMTKAGTGNQAKGSMTADERAKMIEVVERVFEPGKMQAELAATLKGSFDAERMARFLELLRQPIALKMTSAELRNVTPEAMREFSESFRKNPPPAARTKLIAALDDVTRTSEVGADMATAMARDMVDAMLDTMQKAGKQVPREARQVVGSQLNSMRNQARSQMRAMMHVMYRNASDDDLSEYVKLLDTDTGRWGSELLASAMRPVMVSRGSVLGREVAQLVMAREGGAMARAAARPKVEEDKAEDKPAVATTAALVTRAAPAEPPAYQRPANIRVLYSKYNDLMTATVMRDPTAVKELLADGKNPNLRQSDGVTPLMVAAGNGDGEIAALLLARGADPNLRAPGGNNALGIAKARNHGDMIKLLERGGAR